MLKTFISILLVLGIALPQKTGGVNNEGFGKDGFNFYKDYLRGRSDEVIELVPSDLGRMLYFYRTPMQYPPAMLPAVTDLEYMKRTGNAYKNHMLTKETWDEGGKLSPKRTSKTALSFIIGKHTPYQNEDNWGTEKIKK